MSIIVIGIDLAKSVFAVHGIHQEGKAELVNPRVNRVATNGHDDLGAPGDNW